MHLFHGYHGRGCGRVEHQSAALSGCFSGGSFQAGKAGSGIHFDGRPVSSNAADQFLNAVLEAWSPAEMGAEAVVGALAGDDNPGGKLPVTVAYHAGQIPIYYNHPGNSCWHQSGSIGFPIM